MKTSGEVRTKQMAGLIRRATLPIRNGHPPRRSGCSPAEPCLPGGQADFSTTTKADSKCESAFIAFRTIANAVCCSTCLLSVIVVFPGTGKTASRGPGVAMNALVAPWKERNPHHGRVFMLAPSPMTVVRIAIDKGRYLALSAHAHHGGG